MSYCLPSTGRPDRLSGPGRIGERGDVLEPGPVQVILLELLSDAPARQPAVLGAAGHVALVAGEELREVVALDPADQVAGQVGQGPLDVDQRAGAGRPPRARRHRR